MILMCFFFIITIIMILSNKEQIHMMGEIQFEFVIISLCKDFMMSISTLFKNVHVKKINNVASLQK